MNNLYAGKSALSTSLLFSAVVTLFVSAVSANELSDGQQLFKKKCSLCHAIDKKKLGPSVKTMSQDEGILLEVISQGRKSMPAYAGKLGDEEIASLVDYLLSQQSK